METFLGAADAVIQILRTALLSIAVVFGIVCVLDWAVRTRKISPFNAIARFCRSTVDPFISPIERKVVRAGGTPASAPLWALAIVVIGGILLLTLLAVLRMGQVELRSQRAIPRSAQARRPRLWRLRLHSDPGVLHPRLSRIAPA